MKQAKLYDKKTCSTCKGKGTVRHMQFREYIDVTCPRCMGLG